MDDLFHTTRPKASHEQLVPLADRLRPQALSQVIGQEHLTGSDGIFPRLLSRKHLPSIILWGPPGTGKTTIARLLAQEINLHFITVPAIFSGVADLKKAFEQARMQRNQGRGSLLFIDEIHRFNRMQQDSFLPYIEDGTVILIGATTENPSFELNNALLSRVQVLVLHRLSDEALEQLITRAELFKKNLLPIQQEARKTLIEMSDGDGRYCLNLVEEIFAATDATTPILTREDLINLVQHRSALYDKGQDGHYNLISALHKSVRGSDPDAALYYLARMLAAGESPLFIARRLVRMAVEDIGLADPQALSQALHAKETYDFLGSPEGELGLAQATIYLATAPKSNATYTAYKSAMRRAKETGSVMPPKIILTAPTKLMKQEQYGAGYEYDHDQPDAFSGQNYFPDSLERECYYYPAPRGFEREIKKRLDYWQNLRRQKEGR